MLRTLLAAAATLGLMCSQPAAAYGEDSPGLDLYKTWLAKGDNAARVATFEAELRKRGLDGVVPTYQILRTALMWKQCKAEPFELPAAGLWHGAFDSLRVLKDEIIPAVGPVMIVSGYRHEALNSCAGGASRSVHRQFGAFDAYAINSTRSAMIDQLCTWHGQHGAELAAGLGIYRGPKFHIDVGLRGNRRWGSDYSSASSPCNGRGGGATVAAK
ncbi:D-Ala-D-Ala carboxypeptidase family metallohydrolase [Pacificimonas flava]|uniref:Peptidase M15A n=1 Tax=Pacificimonas flava TaxID=1234595 RepID=M2S9A6_9SPHN|nr:D-Ala-D-Ala carboxypeptidase family metallohydrolase [Pacificimonas flava]EMD81960.1 Peptidase M15A [Pacificimonas flava]MBB5280476.1 hypothetical protein [Pacificimonas flava]